MQQPVWGTSVGFPKAQLGVDNRGLGDHAGPRAAEAGGHSLQLSVGQPLVVSGWHLELIGFGTLERFTRARSSLYPASAGSQEEEDDEDEDESEGSGTAPCHCHNQAPTGFPIGTWVCRWGCHLKCHTVPKG